MPENQQNASTSGITRVSTAINNVLTSHDTFSGAEEFAYDVQAFKRAQVIGAATRGAAHGQTRTGWRSLCYQRAVRSGGKPRDAPELG